MKITTIKSTKLPDGVVFVILKDFGRSYTKKELQELKKSFRDTMNEGLVICDPNLIEELIVTSVGELEIREKGLE